MAIRAKTKPNGLNSDIRYVRVNPFLRVNLEIYESHQARLDGSMVRSESYSVSKDTMDKIKSIIYEDIKVNCDWLSDSVDC